MADQLPTVANFPSGYATIAGLLYAVSATEQSNWDLVVWNRASKILCHHRWWFGNWSFEEGFIRQHPRDSSSTIEKLITALSKCITKHSRHFSGPCWACKRSEGENQMDHLKLAEWTAAISLVLQIGSELSRNGVVIPEILRGGRDMEMQAMETVEPGGIIQAEEMASDEPSRDPVLHSASISQTSNVVPSLTMIVVDIVSESGIIETHQIRYTPEWLGEVLDQEELRRFWKEERPPKQTWNDISPRLFVPKTQRVTVQIAADVEIFLVELGYKFIEIIFSGAILLGSTGGAWLGLTLSSLFPTRRSAGVFTSAYGQIRSPSWRRPEFENRYIVAAGTVQVSGFSIHPRGLTDDARVFIGYSVTFIYLLIMRQFKNDLRDLLEFSIYSQTKDAIRWIILFIQLFVAIFLARALVKEVKQKKIRLAFLAPTVVTYLGCNVMVFLAQKTFGPLGLLARIVDPVAAAGCLATMAMNKEHVQDCESITRSSLSSNSGLHTGSNVERNDANNIVRDHTEGSFGRVAAERWILIWAIGACTCVY